MKIDPMLVLGFLCQLGSARGTSGGCGRGGGGCDEATPARFGDERLVRSNPPKKDLVILPSGLLVFDLRRVDLWRVLREAGGALRAETVVVTRTEGKDATGGSGVAERSDTNGARGEGGGEAVRVVVGVPEEMESNEVAKMGGRLVFPALDKVSRLLPVARPPLLPPTTSLSLADALRRRPCPEDEGGSGGGSATVAVGATCGNDVARSSPGETFEEF